MRRKNLDLLLALLIAAVSVVWACLPNHPLVVSILCAFFLVFVIPGYTMSEALFVYSPSKNHSLIRKPVLRITGSFNGSDRLILSLGLSIALVIITGFVLNMLPMGLEQTSWAVSLATSVAIFSCIALYRRHKVHRSTVQTGTLHIRISFYEYALFLLAIIIVVASVWYSLINAQQQQQQSTFTQFWMVPSKQAHNSCAVLIGMQSFEVATEKYTVVITANGMMVNSWSAITLAPQNQWYQSVTIQPKDTNTIYVEAKLYRMQHPGIVYRTVHITFNSAPGNNSHVLAC